MTIKYQVKKGDTLSSIAEKHTTTASAIARYNHIANPNRILLGQLIKFESSVEVIFKDKQSRPISGLSVRLESQATGVRRLKTSTDGSLPPVIFSSMSDCLKISIVRGDDTEKTIASIRPSGEKRVVTIMAPSVRIAAISAPRLGGTPRATQVPAGAAAEVRPNPPTVAPQQRQNRQLEKSGAQWVARFPTSQSLDDLEDPFKTNAKAFVAALRLVEVSVRISATYRPNERSYLMHFCAAIARGTISPGRVPSYPNVNIDWLHLDENGKADMDSAKTAAKAMKDAYGIGDNPVAGPGRSNHNIRLAMDITISNYVGKKPKDKEGKEHEIKEWSDIVEFGKKFDVIWFGRRDRPHWSPDGH